MQKIMSIFHIIDILSVNTCSWKYTISHLTFDFCLQQNILQSQRTNFQRAGKSEDKMVNVNKIY